MFKAVVLLAFALIQFAASATNSEFVFNKFVVGLTPRPSVSETEKIISRVTNEQDRATLRNFLNSWRPKPELQILSEPFRLTVYKNKKKALDLVWLFSSPPTVKLDGEFVVLDQEFKSYSEALNQAWKIRYGKSKSASSFSILSSEAFAEGQPEFKDLAISYFILHKEVFGDARRALSVDGYAKMQRLEMLPELTTTERWTWKNLKCIPSGIEPQSFEYAGRKIKLTAQTPFVYKVEGASNDGKQLLVEINNSSRSPAKSDAFACGRQGITGEKTCDKLWSEFFNTHPGTSDQFLASGRPTQTCDIYDKLEFKNNKLVENYPCLSFFTEKYAQLRPNRTEVTNKAGETRAYEIRLCDGDDCSKPDKRSWQEIGLSIDPSIAELDKTYDQEELRAAQSKFMEKLKNLGVAEPQSFCNPEKCRIPPDAAKFKRDDLEALRSLLEPTFASANRLLPSKNLAIGMHNKIGDKALGMLLMADCCNKAECKRALYKNFSINLVDEAKAPETNR